MDGYIITGITSNGLIFRGYIDTSVTDAIKIRKFLPIIGWEGIRMKQLTEQQEVDNIVDVYFAHMKGKYFIEMLKSFSQGRGYGMESSCCILATK